jgi:hypothetical protein
LTGRDSLAVDGQALSVCVLHHVSRQSKLRALRIKPARTVDFRGYVLFATLGINEGRLRYMSIALGSDALTPLVRRPRCASRQTCGDPGLSPRAVLLAASAAEDFDRCVDDRS